MAGYWGRAGAATGAEFRPGVSESRAWTILSTQAWQPVCYD